MEQISAVTVSRNGKLNTGMSVETLRAGSYKNEKEMNKAISLFVKTDKNNDGMLDADEIKAYDKKQTLKKAGIIAGCVLAAAAIGLFARRAINANKIVSTLKPIAQTGESLSEAEIVKQALNGKLRLSSEEVNSLLENCQKGFITDGKPIPNYMEKIKAVLNNPEEVKSISGWSSKPAGIWRAIQDPLGSTVEANPGLF